MVATKLRLDIPYLTQERSDEIPHTLYDETGTMLTSAELERKQSFRSCHDILKLA